MGVRAVIVVHDDSGQQRRFWAPWASKQNQIRYAAQFIHTTDQDGTPLTVDGYIAYITAHPDTLPAQDITDKGGYADPAETGDLDYRYQLWLCQTQRSVRYVVYNRYRDGSGWQPCEDLGTRGQLYEAAARMCRELASNIQRYMDRNNGFGMPGYPGAGHWHEQEAQFAEWLEHTDQQLLHRPGPAVVPPPRQYPLTARRMLARQVNTQLRRHYPEETIRSRMGTGGELTLTVPTRLADDTHASVITRIVGEALGQPFTCAVRLHRPSRHGVQTSSTCPDGNATLTLQPAQGAAADVDAVGVTATEDTASQ